MRIGIVSPYSFDVPGGVQLHVRDLAEYLISLGHYVSVLAPADDDTPLPDYVVSTGRAVPVRYNGSVARLSFGPMTAARVGRWVEAGRFDVVHLHEPVTPSVSVLALWAVEGPIVATFHTSNLRSRAMQAAYPLLRPSLEKISARIAVSEDARRTVTTHLGGDAVVIPNGVFVERFASAPRRPDWEGTVERPTIAFLGRMEEPRKGMPVLSQALPHVLREIPGVRVLIPGPGDPGSVRDKMTPQVAAACDSTGIPLRGSSIRPRKAIVGRAGVPTQSGRRLADANRSTNTPLGITTASPPRCVVTVRRASSETAMRALIFSRLGRNRGYAACMARERRLDEWNVATMGPYTAHRARTET